MRIVEYIKNVKRPCECNKGLVWWKKTYKTRIKAKGLWTNDFVQLLTKQDKYKDEHRYIAECKICGKLYFSTLKKKELIESLKFLGFEYKEKSSQGFLPT